MYVRITFDHFRALCEVARSAKPDCADWSLSFSEKDYQREWHVVATAKSGKSRHIQVSSARVESSTAEDVINRLIRKMSTKMELEPLAEDPRFGITYSVGGREYLGRGSNEYRYPASGGVYLLETDTFIDACSLYGDDEEDARESIKRNLAYLVKQYLSKFPSGSVRP